MPTAGRKSIGRDRKNQTGALNEFQYDKPLVVKLQEQEQGLQFSDLREPPNPGRYVFRIPLGGACLESGTIRGKLSHMLRILMDRICEFVCTLAPAGNM